MKSFKYAWVMFLSLLSVSMLATGDDHITLVSPIPGVAATAHGALVQMDGKRVVVGGSSTDYIVMRYNSDGSLDNTFDGDGIVQTNINGSDTAYAVRQQADGKLVVAGYTGSGMTLVRYLTNGALDTSFGVSGKVSITASGNMGVALAQQSDGKWLAVGLASFSGKVARFTQDGILDTTFGNNGYITVNGGIDTIAIQADGKFVVAGCQVSGFTGCINHKLWRYQGNGVIDLEFGTNGTVDGGSTAENIFSVLIQPDGKIVGGIGVPTGSATGSTILVRYNSDGTPDSSFGVNGRVQANLTAGVESIKSIALQADGRIVATGSANNGTNNDLMLLRYNTDGSFDTTLDGDGVLLVDLNGAESGNALTIPTEGLAFVAGTSNTSGINQFLIGQFDLPSAPDQDSDGIEDAQDNCVAVANADQSDLDADGAGNVCDSTPFGDLDNDTVDNMDDNCPAVANVSQTDTDNDAIGDACDADQGGSPSARVIGGKVFAAGGDVYVKVLAAEAGYTSELHLSSPGPDRFIALNRDAGTLVNLGSFPVGTELVFSIYVRDTDKTFSTGPASRNPDNMIHAAVEVLDDGLSTVGFEDLFGGGDQDYNDNMFRFFGVVVQDMDGDGIPDISDPDMDGDGVLNADDAFPLDPAEVLDTDGDGTGNNADTDDDGDGLSDMQELTLGTDPLRADTDYDRIHDGVDPLPLGLDLSFNGDGLLLESPAVLSNLAQDILRQADGKLVVVGSANNDFVILRYNTDGSLDTSFSGDGMVVANINGGDTAYSVRQQSDGKLVVAGLTGNGITLVRYHTNGAIDTSFGTSGMASTSGSSTEGVQLAQQVDGRWVVVSMDSMSGKMARFSQNGALDTAFGSNGVVTISGGTSELAIQADGKFIVAGCQLDGLAGCISYRIWRYLANGTIDSSFGAGNGYINGPVANEYVSALAVQPDGKILASINNNSTDSVLVRYHADGTLDNSFGLNGHAQVQVSTGAEALRALELQPGGKIVVTGYAHNGSDTDITLLRYNPDGSLDSSFDSDGMTVLDAGLAEYGNAVLVEPNGHAVVAGYSNVSGTNQILVARFMMTDVDTDADGTIDGFDVDDDNDGVLDANDAFPLDAFESVDTDGDGTGNNADTDDDNDGVADAADKFPLDAGKSKFVRHDTEADGDSDVLTRSASTGAWTSYGIQGNTVIDAAVMNVPTASNITYVAQLDANGDGDADILTRNTATGAWTLSIVESGAVTSSVPLYLYANLDQQFVGSGDFNNDGVDDVMLRSASAGYYTVFLLANHGVSSAVYYNSWTSAQSVPQGIGDFDGDGTDDLLVRRTSDNLYFIFKTINGAVNNYYCACNIWANPDWTFQFAGDTNNDSIDDVIVRGTGASADGKWWAFRMNNFSSVLTTNLNLFVNKTAVSVGAAGDYNGDGTIDVLTRVNNSTTYVSPIMNGAVTGNYWLYNFTTDQVIGK